MTSGGRVARRAGGSWIGPLLLALGLLLGTTSAAQADDCSDYGGVLDGFAGTIAPAQLQIDGNCTIRNYPASNPLSTNFSFLTQPGQTNERWLIVFDNVVHTGQMSCNAVQGHKIWFVNGSSSRIKQNCQNLLIPVEKIEKQVPAGQTTAAIGVPFTYTLTIPVLFDPATGAVIQNWGSPNDLHSVTIRDDLNDLNTTGTVLTYLSHTAYWETSGAPVAHTFSNVGGLLTFEVAPIIPANEQIIIEITVVLDDVPGNEPGKSFVNTAKWDFGRLIEGVFYVPLPGEWGISEPLMIAAPQLEVTKTGPATLGRALNLGEWGQFTVDVENAGTSDAWNVTILDRLPDGPSGGMCDLAPELLGVTLAGSPLVQGTDYTLSWAPAPSCELTLTLLDAAGAIGPGEHLVIDYRSKLDADSPEGATLTNVAGATQWSNDASGNPNRQTYTRDLTDGSVGVVDHEDAHTVTVALSGYFFEKTVANLTTGVSPATIAAAGDTLRYTLRLQSTDVALTDVAFQDDLGVMNATAVFVPGSLSLVAASLPPGADASLTNPNAGTNGAGILDVRNLNVPVNGQVQIQFDITLDPTLADGVVVSNQADLISTVKIADSDDPNVNGQADPAVPGDEDPTRVVIGTPPPPALGKANTQATATIGEAFRYRITVPETPNTLPLYDVRITDDLSASAADLRFLSVTKISGSGPFTPVNTGTAQSLVIEDPAIGIDIPAGEQIVLEITVVLENTATNVAGLSFTNTADYTYNRFDGDDSSQRPGAPGTSPPMTIVEPELTLEKSGPAQMSAGVSATFTLDVHNTGGGTAFDLTLLDRLPDGPTGGTCDAAPSQLTARVFLADGVTPVSPPLVQGTDFSAVFQGAPTCELTLTLLTPASVIGPDQRLIVTYQVQLDADTQNSVSLTNVAGATEWFSTDGSNPATASDRRTYTRALTDGTPGTLDHQDAHTVTVSLEPYRFEKTATNLTTGESPATRASPGNVLRYRIEFENLGTTPLTGLTLVDELDRLNDPAVFQAGTLTLITAPAGADASNTSSTGGPKGTGLLDVRNLSIAPGQTIVVELEVTLAPVIANGTYATNQSQLEVSGGGVFASSDDPNVNGAADPFASGDEDPTRILIESAPLFRVEKISTDVTGDPNLLLAGETLRYRITVKNVGTADAVDTVLRDAIPVSTQYVAGSTTLNGTAVPDGAGGTAPLSQGISIYAPQDPTPGAMHADASATTDNVATLVFDVVVDPSAPDGTIISNQAFVSAIQSGITDVPSDDPDTPTPDDPTRDVVGSSPLLFAPKQVALRVDGGTPGIVDPGDVLHYTITVQNSGAVPATGAVLTDSVPANTTYVADSTTLNGLPVGQPDGGVAPLASGIPISSSDLTPPLPGVGQGTINPGQSAVLEFDLQVNAGVPTGTLISNQAVVGTAELPNVLTDGDGNPATGPEPTVVVVGDAQQLTITKQVAVVGGGPALAGAQLEYLVRVTNVGAVPAYGVVITDDLAAPVPGYLSYVAGSALLNGSANGVTFAGSLLTADYSALNGPLPPGGSITLRFQATIDPGLAMGTTITNVAVVTWNTNQTASASVSIDVGGMVGVGTLSGTVWHDADFDLTVSGSERLLAGWTVELLRNGQLTQSVLTDASGTYRITSVPPNDQNGDQYVLRFRAPGAGASTASLGTADSAYTNGPQQISDIPVTGGANLQDLDLPITPNGVVYDALQRTPIPGAALSLLSAAGAAPLPTTCFDDPLQQGQVTGSDGFYKFDVNFSDPACPAGGDYVVAVIAPGAGYSAGYSQIIPPLSSPGTAPFSVPACPSSTADAVPTTPQHCEAQPSELAPPLSVPARSAGTSYYVHVALDDSNAPGSSQLFNNHIPLDPVLTGAVMLTKTTPSVNVSRGQLVPYEITVANQLGAPIPDLSVVDRFPAGFHYVEGSARVDGVAVEPTINGRELLWPDLGVDPVSRKSLQLLLAVGGGVSEGEFVNRAQAISSLTGALLSGEATARVRVVPDPTFDCTDVIGKVFDDRDRNGVQGRGEAGLPGVRLVTARGLVATTDRHGRFHITCAATPNEARGTNFVLKLDDRTLPSGYRMSTPPTLVKRATSGKALRFNFAASIHHVVGLDLADPVFEPDTTAMREHWRPRLDLLMTELRKAPAVLRLSYVADVEDAGLVERRLHAVKSQIEQAWGRSEAPLSIETEVFWRRGGPVAGARTPAERTGGAWKSWLPSITRPPTRESVPGAAVERHLPSDEPRMQWSQDPKQLEQQAGDRLEQREVPTQQAKTVKLTNVVPAIHFESGVANIPPSTIQKLREVLSSMQHLHNVRLHLVGHADAQPLSPALSRIFGDNAGLSRERAGEVAEFIQRALALPPESIAFDWAGDTLPIAPNTTEAGRAQNRRVEVEVWYDELEDALAVEEVVVPEDIKRVKVCRTETVCKLRYVEGHARRARIKNLIAPLHYDEESLDVPEAFVRQIEQALYNLRNEQNVTVKLIGFTDDAPLAERAERIYGTHLALSKARAHRVALAVKDALDLPTPAIASDGFGEVRPLASNRTERGRALNRRIEVEFWHDDPLQELPEEPQLCPDEPGEELVTRVYEPSFGPLAPLALDGGEPRIPVGYTSDLQRAMAEVAGEKNVRLRFVGYTGNERLDRRTALAYGDDIGLSVARARRAMEAIRSQLGLGGSQVEAEGRGYVHSDDVVNAGFLAGETSHVAVQVVYDELAVRDDLDGIDIKRLTRELSPKNPLALNLLHITVDGEPIDDPGRSLADIQRCTDVALERADIQFGFDDLAAAPRLSVTSSPSSVALPGTGGGPISAGSVRFATYTNYGPFIARSEIRILELGQSREAEPLAVIPVDANGRAEWRPDPAGLAGPARELRYVLRAYDAEGRFDETAPQALWLVQGGAAAKVAPEPDPALLAGYGESGPLARAIPLGNAGTVKVRGTGIPPQHTVALAGTPVPVDERGAFAAELLLPTGMHTVEVAVLDPDGNGELFLRDLRFDTEDWFYVGVADLTLAGSQSSGPIDALTGKNAPYDPDSFVDGRLAFFVTGKFGEGWGLTASADTREGPLEDVFTNFLDKSPESLFRRLDPDLYFPTFGDDGTVQEAAPTSGKLFAKLNRGESHLLWGNFDVGYRDNELAHVDRGLYGANLHFQTDATTSAGEQRIVVDGFAAEPGTVPSREEFRVTGGSLYWLGHQDLLTGSDRLRIEVRDKDSGLVSSVVYLQPAVDYDIDYLQGRILLSQPVATNVEDSLLVRSQGLSGNEAWLVVQYEYTPGFDDLDAMAFGGQGEAWLTDWMKLGLTANRNQDGGADNSLYGGHLIFRKSADSWIKLQAGRSEGLVSSSVFSSDGGFSFFGAQSLIPADADAAAYRADLSVGLGDFVEGRSGRLHLYAQLLGAGYTAPGQTALTDTDHFGGRLELPLTDKLTLAAKADSRLQDQGLETTAGEVDVAYKLTSHWTVSSGVRTEQREDGSPVVPVTQEEGGRTDAVVQAAYASGTRWRGYAFGQATLSATGDREDNRRGGIGGAHRFGERLTVEGEVSHGDLGPAAKLGTNYQESEHTRRYMSYSLDNEQPETGLHQRRGNLVSGARTRLSDSGSVYLEDRYQHTDAANGLTRSMGITLTPTDRWSLGANWATGTLIDHQTAAETERTAAGAQVGYALGAMQLASGVEYRFDKTEQPGGSWSNRETWLFRNSVKMQLTPSWQLVGKLNHSYSDSSLGDFYDGDFTEGVIGYAYRPVAHDRLNALVKYTYFYNLPGAEQVTPKNTLAQFVQKSHIASLDATFDVTEKWSIGGKYAYRLGEVSLDRKNPDFFDNSAQLFILRNDLRFRRFWEASLEARLLHLPDLRERRSGALISISRYLGEHFKVGVGYNFTDFSDDLTDLSFDDHGFFLNLVGSL